MQALAVSYLCEHEKELRPQLYLLPRELDEKVAEIKLKSMGYEIDTLSDKQKEYLGLD
jgi:adenosylhomocysteinase